VQGCAALPLWLPSPAERHSLLCGAERGQAGGDDEKVDRGGGGPPSRQFRVPMAGAFGLWLFYVGEERTPSCSTDMSRSTDMLN
jgi:hypothetical protein